MKKNEAKGEYLSILKEMEELIEEERSMVYEERGYLEYEAQLSDIHKDISELNSIQNYFELKTNRDLDFLEIWNKSKNALITSYSVR